jgi:5'-nucleotidase
MKEFKNVLLVNDDGYDSKGIFALKKKIEPHCQRVVIVAPDVPMSGKSTSMTIDRALKLIKVKDDEYRLDGTPADCVSLAITSLGIDFDLVLSGCNDGLNFSYDTMYSGTIGATMEAMKYRKRSIAFSNPFYDDFSSFNEHFEEVFAFIMSNKLLSQRYTLNVNFPVKGIYRGVKLSKLYYRDDRFEFIKQDNGLLAKRYIKDEDYPLDSDCRDLKDGYVSITPLARTTFNSILYSRLKKKIKNN